MPRRPDLPCSTCGKLMWRGRGSLPEGQARCSSCRGRGEGPQHGSLRKYKSGCRCAACKAENARSFRQHRANRAARDNPIPKHSNHGNRYNLPPAMRAAIYERDEWACQICLQPVDPLLDYNDPMAATLDHVVPQSIRPDHSEDNLRLAHRICNARRGNRSEATA